MKAFLRIFLLIRVINELENKTWVRTFLPLVEPALKVLISQGVRLVGHGLLNIFNRVKVATF